MGSLFSRLYKYTWSTKKHSRENYLTEILAFALESNESFRNAFFGLIQCKSKLADIQVQTQIRDTETGIPDIVLQIGQEDIIVIEVKVASRQGKNQLQRYSEFLLSKDVPNKYLVYLTKYIDSAAIDYNEINFCTLRWHNVFAILEPYSDQVSMEFKKYLIEERMDRKIDLESTKSSAFSDYIEFCTSIEELLVECKEQLKLIGVSRIVNRTSHERGEIGFSISDWAFPIWIGFYQHEHYEVKFGVSADSVPANHQMFEDIQKQFEKRGVESYEILYNRSKAKTFYTQYSFSEFLVVEKFDHEKAISLLVDDVKLFKKILDQ